MLFYYLFPAILAGSVFGDQQLRRVIRQDESSSCLTPDNLPGDCINIKTCTSLFQLLLTQGMDPTVGTFLKNSQCGLEGITHKVCCPRAPPADHSSTTVGRSITPKTTTTAPGGKQDETDYSRCGKSDKKATRIVGGQNATLGDWPWVVALGYRTSVNPGPLFRCGASLISDRWIVTAAHCVVNIGSLVPSIARVGDLDLNDNGQDNASPIDVPIDQVIPHPNHVPSPLLNDIALIRLRNAVTFTRLIRPICILRDTAYDYADKSPFIAGWGAVAWRGPSSNFLKEAQVDTVPEEDCARVYPSQTIDQRVVCAGRDGTDTCQGDSGGPLIVPVGSTYYLAGVVSFGFRCAEPGFPGVYTKVAQFADWITRTAGL